MCDVCVRKIISEYFLILGSFLRIIIAVRPVKGTEGFKYQASDFTAMSISSLNRQGWDFPYNGPGKPGRCTEIT